MRRILPVVGVVVLVLVLGFVVLGSCSGSSKADKYRSYVQDVNSVARQSNADAKTLDATLYNQELTPDQVTAKIATLIPRASAAETTAASLKPVGKIKQQGLQRYLCSRCSTARWRCRSSRPRSRRRSRADATDARSSATRWPRRTAR